MRILNLVAGEKWTGAAAVVFGQTSALVDAGLEAQFAFVRDSLLAQRIQNVGWARPLFEPPPRWPTSYARDFRTLRDTVLREKFDIVHAHGSHDHWVAAFALAGTRALLVRTVHNLRHARRLPFTRAPLARTRALAYANREIARAVGLPGPIQQAVVDTDRFQPGTKSVYLRRRFGLPEEMFLVGTIGKMARGRGHMAALDVIARLPKSFAAAHVGHGELTPVLKERAAALGLAERNFWLGYQEEQLPEIYRCFDAFLFMASGSEQGHRAVLEAMASGLPVVALDVPGIADLVNEGKEGFVARSVKDLAERLARLLYSPQLCAAMGSRARERSLNFTGEKFSARARDFYDEVMQAASR